METPNLPCSKPHTHFLLPRSFQRIRPIPRLCVTFHNKLVSYSEEFLVSRPTPKLEDHPLSALRNLRTCHAVVTETHLTWDNSFLFIFMFYEMKSWRDNMLFPKRALVLHILNLTVLWKVDKRLTVYKLNEKFALAFFSYLHRAGKVETNCGKQ